MKVTFQFNPKSKGQNVSHAVTLVKEWGGIIEGDNCQIDFDSLEDKNFIRLCYLVGNLKDAKVSINDKEPINARIIRHIATCAYRDLCKENFEYLTSNPQVSDDANLNHEDSYEDDSNDFLMPSNPQVSDDANLNHEDSYEDDSHDFLMPDLPLGYICKRIRLEDGEMVQVSYKSFDDMLKVWEGADYLRDKYVFNIIKLVDDTDEDLIQKNIKKFESRYGKEK